MGDEYSQAVRVYLDSVRKWGMRVINHSHPFDEKESLGFRTLGQILNECQKYPGSEELQEFLATWMDPQPSLMPSLKNFNPWEAEIKLLRAEVDRLNFDIGRLRGVLKEAGKLIDSIGEGRDCSMVNRIRDVLMDTEAGGAGDE